MTFSQQNGRRPIVTLTTDFGEKDGYVGVMRGVILRICPAAVLADLSHDIPPQDIRAAAFVLYRAFGYYPPHAVHCVVVDPGVGSKRRAIAVRTNQGFFVGPDNGVFGLALAADDVNVLEAVTLTNPDYQLPNVSATFHGRDIFAPAAAHIANGAPLAQFGPSAINLVRLGFELKCKNSECRVIHIDRFGNLTLNITAHDIDNPPQVTFTIGRHIIKSLRRTFADVAEGRLVAYTGSLRNHVEIAIRNGNAAQTLGVQLGDIVTITDSLDLEA
ncbi:MAG: SAM-dependent chlorinase/fluorinase [Anaerolineae bacterium]|nr:SAM-dependent chlorinase/fluorinase [Anaerolineae bacterium]